MTPRVLVCDDAPGVRLLMASALEEAGLEVAGPAASWNEAIDTAAAERPDAVLVDLWMPTYEPSQLERLCAAVPDALIFVLSVLPVEQARAEIAGVGRVAGVYSKPEPPQLIAERVRDTLLAAVPEAAQADRSRGRT
jgi:two-component system KDP operon response regulator KdpE